MALDEELEENELEEQELPVLDDTLLLLQISMIVQTSICLQPFVVVVVVVVVAPPPVVVRAAVVVALPKVFVLPRARPRALSNVVVVLVITSLQSSWKVQTFWRQLEDELDGSDNLELEL